MNLKGQPARDMIKQQYDKQRSRGHDGFGFVATAGTPKLCRRTDEKVIMNELKKTDAAEILFHHRFPTSTDNVRNACHPFKIKGTKSGHWYYVVHNGVIQNDDELKEKHDKMSLKYKSIQEDKRFNDSEALANEIMLYLEGEQKALEARGSVAFICQEFDEHSRPINLHYCRNSGNPLRIKYRKGSSLQIASELNGKEIAQDVHYTYNYKTDSFSEKPLDIKRYGVSTYKESDREEWDNYFGHRNYGSYAQYDYGYPQQQTIWKNQPNANTYEPEYNVIFRDSEEYNQGFDDALECEASMEDIPFAIKELAEIEEKIINLLTEWQTTKSDEEKDVIKLEIKKEVGEKMYYRGFVDGLYCSFRSYVDAMDWQDDDECDLPIRLMKELNVV
jgi:predicted glutamine amidotransferase